MNQVTNNIPAVLFNATSEFSRPARRTASPSRQSGKKKWQWGAADRETGGTVCACIFFLFFFFLGGNDCQFRLWLQITDRFRGGRATGDSQWQFGLSIKCDVRKLGFLFFLFCFFCFLVFFLATGCAALLTPGTDWGGFSPWLLIDVQKAKWKKSPRLFLAPLRYRRTGNAPTLFAVRPRNQLCWLWRRSWHATSSTLGALWLCRRNVDSHRLVSQTLCVRTCVCVHSGRGVKRRKAEHIKHIPLLVLFIAQVGSRNSCLCIRKSTGWLNQFLSQLLWTKGGAPVNELQLSTRKPVDLTRLCVDPGAF